MKTLERQILTNAIEKNGTDEQMRIAQEECAELIQAISKYQRAQLAESRHRGHATERATKHLIEEIADVSIMVDQLKLMIKGNHNDVREQKITRIGERIQKGDK